MTLASVIVMSFGCDALLQCGVANDAGSRSRTHRVASATARTVAAIAAGAIGLIVFGMIFGDKIEVMRR